MLPGNNDSGVNARLQNDEVYVKAGIQLTE